MRKPPNQTSNIHDKNIQDEAYLERLSDEQLSSRIRQLAPKLIVNLTSSDALLKVGISRYNKLSSSALFALIDVLMLQGRFELAEQLLPKGPKDAIDTRRAWIMFVRGDTDGALYLFNETLEDIRRTNYNSDFYYSNITGIIFILTLIKKNTRRSLSNALSYAKLGLKNQIWSNIYNQLKPFIEGLCYGDVPKPRCPLNMTPLDTFFTLLIEYWQNPFSFMATKRDMLQSVKDQAQLGGYELIAAECEELSQRLNKEWIPGKPTGVSFWKDGSLVSILDCFPVLPTWAIELKQLGKALNLEDAPRQARRLAWVLEVIEPNETITVRLVEQQLTKTKKWSKGRCINFEKLLPEVESTQSWPTHYTPLDIQAISLMRDLTVWQNEGGDSLYAQAFDLSLPLLLLKNHPRLLWNDKDELIPASIVESTPYAKFIKIDHRLQIEVVPENKELKRIVATREHDSQLILHGFSQRALDIAKIANDGLSLPSEASQEIQDICLKLVNEMPILSDQELVLDELETIYAVPKPVVKLSNESNLEIEILVKPYEQLDILVPIGEPGSVNLVAMQDQVPIKFARDLSSERASLDKLLEFCPELNARTKTGTTKWTLDDPIQKLDFVVRLKDLQEQAVIFWRSTKKMRVSRRLGRTDLNVEAIKKNDWFSLEGNLQVDEDLTLDFQKLLKLASQQKGTYIELDDGQIIAITNEFRRQLDDINSLGEFHDDSFELNPFAFPAAMALFEASPDAYVLEDSWVKHSQLIDKSMKLVPKLPGVLSPSIKLRQYQLEGYQWLCRLDSWGAGACLADDMGLGKTIQALAFIASRSSEGPTLVVAPMSVCNNWLSECSQVTPHLNVLVFGAGNREEMLSSLKPNDLLITTYGLLQSEIDSFQKVHWRVAVLDEAQQIKNYQAKRSQAALSLNAQFKLVTTGTPLENNLSELWTIFEFIAPGLLGSRSHFQDKFAYPIEKFKDQEAAERLNQLIKPFLLRRKKEQVLKELPPKTEVTIMLEQSDTERAFYEAVRRQLIEQFSPQLQADPKRLEQERIRILAAITKLMQAACNPKLLDPTVAVPSAKLEAFKQIVQGLVSEGHKTLVFSQFVKHLDIIRSALDTMGITYQYLDGSTPRQERIDAIDAFQDGQSDLFLISLKAGGLGLNLTRADFVIILDSWWNPAVEDQASDRAHRIGQTKPVTIYRLISQSTIESKIIALHQDKRDLAEQILAGADTPTTISAEELLKLITEN